MVKTILTSTFVFFLQDDCILCEQTRFYVGKPPFVPIIRELPITNTFGFTMVIYDAAFPSEVDSVFSVCRRIIFVDINILI